MTEPNQTLAKDVATELDRRRRRRKLTSLLILALLVAAAIMLVRFGKGWGLWGGGSGTGTDQGTGSATPQPFVKGQRCSVRVTAKGIMVDGTLRSRDEAVAACKKTDGALVTVTGDARQGDWEELSAAFQAVGITIYTRGVQTDINCKEHPDAEGCKPATK